MYIYCDISQFRFFLDKNKDLLQDDPRVNIVLIIMFKDVA